MLSRQEEEQERIARLLQDAELRRREQQQAGTYLSHTHSELGGRFALTEHQIIIGVASPAPPPLPASSPWSGAQSQPGIEPPLGVEINKLTPYELETSTSHPGVEAGASAAEAPPSVQAETVDGVDETGAAGASSSTSQERR